MPYEWVEPEVALEHEGVTIYHAYKDDFMTSRLTYWFMLDECGQGMEDSFDVRRLAGALGMSVGPGGHDIPEVLKAAIDEGVIVAGMSVEELMTETIELKKESENGHTTGRSGKKEHNRDDPGATPRENAV